MGGTRQTIYIIDDDESVRRALQRLIRSVGLHAAAFASAEEFLQSPEPAPACIILCDHFTRNPGLHSASRTIV
jgi:FixJ family two-component response regulator